MSPSHFVEKLKLQGHMNHTFDLYIKQIMAMNIYSLMQSVKNKRLVKSIEGGNNDWIQSKFYYCLLV